MSSEVMIAWTLRGHQGDLFVYWLRHFGVQGDFFKNELFYWSDWIFRFIGNSGLCFLFFRLKIN